MLTDFRGGSGSDAQTQAATAIRCYSKVGFKPVGILRAYWHSPEGEWRDGLLMDMLRADFKAAPASI